MTASLKSFYQENEISDDDLNCEFEGVLGTTASIVGATQANEALKMIMEIGQNLKKCQNTYRFHKDFEFGCK